MPLPAPLKYSPEDFPMIVLGITYRIPQIFQVGIISRFTDHPRKFFILAAPSLPSHSCMHSCISEFLKCKLRRTGLSSNIFLLKIFSNRIIFLYSIYLLNSDLLVSLTFSRLLPLPLPLCRGLRTRVAQRQENQQLHFLDSLHKIPNHKYS